MPLYKQRTTFSQPGSSVMIYAGEIWNKITVTQLQKQLCQELLYRDKTADMDWIVKLAGELFEEK